MFRIESVETDNRMRGEFVSLARIVPVISFYVGIFCFCFSQDMLLVLDQSIRHRLCLYAVSDAVLDTIPFQHY